MGMAIILFILVMQFLHTYMDEIMGKGLDGSILLHLLFFASIKLSVTAMPVAVLTAALMTFGSMGEHYELAAAKSCGVSLLQLMRPLIGLSIFLAGVSLYFTCYLVPQANLKFYSMIYDVQRTKADVVLKPGHFYSDIDRYVIRIADKNKETGMLYDVRVYNHVEARGNVDIILADSARIGIQGNGHVMLMMLYNGERYEDYKDEPGEARKFSFGRTRFDSLYYKFNLRGFSLDKTDESLFAKHQITMPYDMIKHAVDSLSSRDTAFHRKFANYLHPYAKIDSNILDPDKVIKAKVWTDTTNQKEAVADMADSISPKRPIISPKNLEKSPRYKPNMGSLFKHKKDKKDTLSLVAFAKDKGVIERFQGMNSVEIVNRALNNARSIKNYSEFIQNSKEEADEKLRLYQLEYYMMHSLPINCIIFMLIGASFGAIIRKGGLGMPALISIIFFVIFYILMSQGRKLAKEGIIEVWLGAWLPVVVTTPIALIATWQATMDAKILDESFWGMVIDNIRGKIIRFLTLFKRKNIGSTEDE